MNIYHALNEMITYIEQNLSHEISYMFEEKEYFMIKSQIVDWILGSLNT